MSSRADSSAASNSGTLPGVHSSPRSDASEAPTSNGTSSLVPMAALSLLSIPILFYGLGSYSMVSGDEGIYHRIARNMLTSGDWFHLEFTGEHRVYDTFLNAPLQYWLRANLIWVLGDNLLSMRIHSAAFGLLSVLALHQFVRRISTPRAAFFSGLALLASYQFVYKHSARTGEVETLICFVLIMAAWSFMTAAFEGRSFLPHFVWVAVLANLKAPLILIPLSVGISYLLLVRNFRPLIRRWLGASLILPFGLLWHLGQLVHLRAEGQVALQAMLDELAAAESPVPSKAGWWFNLVHYAKVTLYGAFPFSIAYPIAFLGLARGPRDPLLTRKLGLLVLYAAAVYAFFLAVRTHHPWYVLPALPFLSALLGVWLDRLSVAETPIGLRVSVVLVAVFTIAIQIDYQNPFAVRPFSPSYSLMHWRDFAPLPSILVLAVAAGTVLALTHWNAPRPLARPGDRVLLIVSIILFGSAFWRVLAPLSNVDHLSDIELVRREIEARRTRGEAIEFPIAIRTKGNFMVRYYFGNDFEIVRAPREANREVHYLLIGEGQTALTPPPYRDAPGGPALPTSASEIGPLPNIILYVVDTLRVDAIASYGNEQVDTPSFDAFARQGTLFENAYAQTSWTRASMASLLTSTYPAVHGAVDRGDLLSDSSLTLSEILQEQGYHTGILTANPNAGSFFGFDQGFDDFVELYARREAGRVDAEELNVRATDVVDLAANWIRGAREPYFLVVLTIDPHSPYLPPAEFDRYGGDSSLPSKGTRAWINRRNLTRAEKARIRSLYLAEVSYSDAAFGELLRRIDVMGARERTLVVLTSDHGEELWEHGRRGHGYTLYEETLRIPLILRHPATIAAGRRVTQSVQSIDIAPTLLELIGAPIPNGMNGRALLAPSSNRAGPTYSSLQLQDARLESVRAGRWKWIWNPRDNRGSLYDLWQSPTESEDVSGAHPKVAQRMASLLADHRKQNRDRHEALHRGAEVPSVTETEIPAAERTLLRHLGYIEDE